MYLMTSQNSSFYNASSVKSYVIITTSSNVAMIVNVTNF